MKQLTFLFKPYVHCMNGDGFFSIRENKKDINGKTSVYYEIGILYKLLIFIMPRIVRIGCCIGSHCPHLLMDA